MKREDWREQFHAALDAARARPAEFGVHDCLMFCARCVEAMTGDNPAAKFGAYTSEAAADRLMARFGGVAGILTEAFGEPVAANWARRGDIVSATVDGLQTAGMCNGTNVVFAGKPRGLTFRPLEVIERTWRID